MKIYIKLLSGDVLTYTARGARGGRCKIATHKPKMEQMVFEHFGLSKETYLVNFFTEDDEKEMDHVYEGFGRYEKSEYYKENSEVLAFVESYEEREKSYFTSCEELLEKISYLYYSLDENIRSITEEQAYKDPAFEKFFHIYQVKEELGNAVWKLSYSLGIPVQLSGGFDPQKNTVK